MRYMHNKLPNFHKKDHLGGMLLQLIHLKIYINTLIFKFNIIQKFRSKLTLVNCGQLLVIARSTPDQLWLVNTYWVKEPIFKCDPQDPNFKFKTLFK